MCVRAMKWDKQSKIWKNLKKIRALQEADQDAYDDENIVELGGKNVSTQFCLQVKYFNGSRLRGLPSTFSQFSDISFGYFLDFCRRLLANCFLRIGY